MSQIFLPNCGGVITMIDLNSIVCNVTSNTTRISSSIVAKNSFHNPVLISLS